MKTAPYLHQNPLLSRHSILWVLGLASLAVSFYSLLTRRPLLLSICLLAVGILLEVLWLKRLQESDTRFLKFIEETSSFEHPLTSPLVLSDLLDPLQSEGFEIEEYFDGNYYCHRQLNQKFTYHFFISNNDTPDCQEAEAYSILCAFGYRIAYDTKANLLYYAEAVTNVIWRKPEIIGPYTSELFQKLFVLD